MRQEVAVPTADGDARAFAFRPGDGDGPWPAVIMFMDAPAIRPALFEMAERLAAAGYYVLLPDMFWRAGPYPPLDIVAARAGDPVQQQLFLKLRASTDAAKQMSDTAACLDWLSGQSQTRAGKVGVSGYCMGCGIALRAAGTFPDRIAAVAGFHGGNLATDEADSPHLLAPKIQARVLIAGADEDRSFPEAQRARLEEALRDAGVKAEVTIYKGARHGYAPPDMPVYDRDASERHWREMLALFNESLKPPPTG